MEVFNGVRFVRLRSVGRSGSYLAADTDGWGVCVSNQRGTHNTVWAVQHVEAFDGTACVALRGTYGRYLVDGSKCARQKDLDTEPTPHSFLWQAALWKRSFVVRAASGGYLRPEEFRGRRELVTCGEDTGTTMMLWHIENVPVRLNRPSILDPAPQLPYRLPPTEEKVTWRFRYLFAKDGAIDEGEWKTQRLRINLHSLTTTVHEALRVNLEAPEDSTLCIRPGRYGELAPLLIDLPICKDNRLINIVIVPHGTPADNELQFPDVDAPTEQEESTLSCPPPDLFGPLPNGPPEPVISLPAPINRNQTQAETSTYNQAHHHKEKTRGDWKSWKFEHVPSSSKNA